MSKRIIFDQSSNGLSHASETFTEALKDLSCLSVTLLIQHIFEDHSKLFIRERPTELFLRKARNTWMLHRKRKNRANLA